ncbi:RloB domain-containing protein [Streptomyces sp. enrichment culture]|uniref:RloB domain-containing protein n=1 Tax=Streptomyces sp. enrichment culture TaxID=1795815 RepID=UPI003F57DB84
MPGASSTSPNSPIWTRPCTWPSTRTCRSFSPSPCFELWLLLHFRDHWGNISGYSQAKQLLVPHHPNYSKAAREFTFGRYRDGWQDAAERAQKLARAGEEAKTNPSSGMWRLIGDIVPAHLRA